MIAENRNNSSRSILFSQRDTKKESQMLVLSRKKNESIVINNDITIVVVEIRGDKVRLGVEAPKEVPVHRREVYDAIRRNDAAAQNRTEPTASDSNSTSAESS
jgi:carbon storage regulator